MAEPPIAEPEPGAPIARDAIDPELIKLKRTRAKIGVITAAGVVALCAYFLVRLTPDRRFGGEPDVPTPSTVAAILEGKVAEDSHITVDANPTMSHAIRAVKSKGDLGYRITPARGTNEKLWLVLPGDGFDKPSLKQYVGRLRKISELSFAGSVNEYANANPRPVFATPAAIRAGLSSGKVATVSGDQVTVADGDRIAFDTIDPNASTIVVSFVEERKKTVDDEARPALMDANAWIAELAKHGVTAVPSKTPGQGDAVLAQARLDVALPVAQVTEKLLTAKLWAARVDPVTRHYETTWGALRASPAGGFAVPEGAPIPDAQLELVGLFVGRGVPSDAYVLITGEVPQDYWYVLPVTITLLGIGLLFAWALVRAIRRDLLPTRA